MPAGGILTMTTRVRPSLHGDAPLLEITVRDTGTGMTPDVLKRATEPFFTTKPLGQGTGLGLSLVYSTATAHGGRMELDSLLGQGTEVTLLLPLAEAQRDVARTIPSEIPAGNGRILLLDDDPAVCSVTGDLLRELGYQVCSFTAPRAALAHAVDHRNELDLVLTDLLMPELNGVQICTELRRQRPSLPVVVYSGRCDDTDEASLRGAGASGILRKPFDIGGLSRSIRAALAT
jgi:CheY-like chemotaxis protein